MPGKQGCTYQHIKLWTAVLTYEKETSIEIYVKVDTTHYNHTLIEKSLSLFNKSRALHDVVDFDICSLIIAGVNVILQS